MVKMQVCVDDHVDVFRRQSGGVQIVKQPGWLGVDLHHLVGHFVADASLNQDIFLSRAHQQRIQSRVEPVQRVGCDLLRPHGFRHDAEKSPGVTDIGSIGDDSEFEIAKRCAIHKNSCQLSVVSCQ